ncbi:MAG: peptide-methionine (S)-S-oxide reductase MsrA [Candidatus Moranbacteria bacterium]|nr:peptide-methionine (S)-S-oxide reductase MsrA [Candidatus Moranbacteria bacterium]
MEQKATFSAGCFWGVEETFRQTEGVTKTRVGYTGGATENPTYEDVCAGDTGHAEAIEIMFDSEKISYEKLLDVFWQLHNPTQVNRQGPDVGDQYRGVIFTHNEEQSTLAKESKKKLEESGKYDAPIATEIVPATEFFQAEQYHQQYPTKKGAKVCH